MFTSFKWCVVLATVVVHPPYPQRGLRQPAIPPAVGTGFSQRTGFRLAWKPYTPRKSPKSSHGLSWPRTPANTVVTAGSITGLLRRGGQSHHAYSHSCEAHSIEWISTTQPWDFLSVFLREWRLGNTGLWWFQASVKTAPQARRVPTAFQLIFCERQGGNGKKPFYW